MDTEINNPPKKAPSISIILPCYNEGLNIHRNILHIEKYLRKNFYDIEIIAVNDGSTDDTRKELQKLRENPGILLKIIDKPSNEGKGAAVKRGIFESQKDIVMFMDADLAIPIEELPAFAKEIEKGSDIVIASRFVSKIKVLEPILWYRGIMEKIFRILRMIIINNYDIQDTQCGFKVFRREAALKIFPLLTVERFSFDVEVIFLANKMGFKIKELPITLQNPQESHIRIVRDSWNMFWDLLRIRWNEMRGKYNIKSQIQGLNNK